MLAKLLLFLLSILSASGQECLALALSGGGGRGGYEAGVLSSLSTSPKSPNMKYNIITGISIGSVNAGLLSQFPIGEEQAMASYLLDLWQSINGTSDIYVEWGGGLIDGLLFQRGLYNNAPVI